MANPIRFTTEKQAQEDIEDLLKANSIPYQREYHLNADDIPDFFIADFLVVEVKIGTGQSSTSIYRQCERYAQHEKVKVVLLITGKTMKLPPQINNKPAFVLNLGLSWL